MKVLKNKKKKRMEVPSLWLSIFTEQSHTNEAAHSLGDGQGHGEEDAEPACCDPPRTHPKSLLKITGV